MSSGQPSSAASSSYAIARTPIVAHPIHSRGPAKFARKPSFAVKREEVKREILLHEDEGQGTRAPVRDEDAQLLLGLQIASPVNASPTLPPAPSRLAISSLVNPQDVPISSHASPLSAPPQITSFHSPPIHRIRARSDSPALDLPTLPLVESSRATTISMSISVEPEPRPEPVLEPTPLVLPEPVTAPSGSKPKLPRIPKKNGSSSMSSPGKVSNTSSPGKNSSSSSPAKASSSSGKQPSSPAKSTPTKTPASPGKSALPPSPSKSAGPSSPGKSSTALTTRKLLASTSSSPLKPRGRVSKGPKKRQGPGWVIESCTTSGAASDDDHNQPRLSSTPDAVIAARLKEAFGEDSDLTDLSGEEEEEEEEEYDPGLAGLPALPLSSESEYEPRDGEVLGPRRRRRSGLNYTDFQNSVRQSIRLVERSAGSPTKSEADAMDMDEDPEDTNNLGSGAATVSRGRAAKGRGRGRGRGASRARSAAPSDNEGPQEQEVGKKPKRGTGSRGGRARGRGRRASSEAPRSSTAAKPKSKPSAESDVESEEEQPGPKRRVRRSSSRPPESDSEPEPEMIVVSKRGAGGSRARGRGRSTSVSGTRGRRAGRGAKSRIVVTAPLSTTSSISLGGNYEFSTSSVLESVVSVESALGPRLRQHAIQARGRNTSSSLTDLSGSAGTGSPSLGLANSPSLGQVDSPSLGGSLKLVGSPFLGANASIARSEVGTVVSETTGVGEVELVIVERRKESPGRKDRSPVRTGRDSPSRRDRESARRGRESPSRRDRESPSRRGREFSSRLDRESPTRRDRESPLRRDRESPTRHGQESRHHKHDSPRREDQESPRLSKSQQVMEVVLPSKHKSRHSAIATPAKLVHADSSRSPQQVFLIVPEVDVFSRSQAEDEERESGKSRRRSRGDRDRDAPAKRSRVDKGKGKAVPDDIEMNVDTTTASTFGRRISRRLSKPSARAIESARHALDGYDENHSARTIETRSTRSSAASEKSASVGPSGSVDGKKSVKRRREEQEDPSNDLKRQRASTEIESTQSKSTQSKVPMVQLREGDFILRLQDKRCFYYNWQQSIVPRCLACRKKQAGDTCRFMNIRYFKLTSHSLDVIGASFDSPRVKEQPDYHLPPTWNILPEIAHIDRIRNVIARALHPVLEEELKHALKANSIWRPLEIEVRATCDVCATSMFASCHMCTRCGRELCGGCYQQVEDMCPVGTPTEYGHVKRKDHQLHKYRACAGNSLFHVPSNFRPITRFIRSELEEILKDMSERIRDGAPSPVRSRPGSSQIAKWASRVPPWNPTSPQASTEPPALSEAGSSHDVSSLRGTPDPQYAIMPIIASPTMSPTHEAGFGPEVGVEAGKRPVSQSEYVDPAGIPSHPIQYFSKDITEEAFKPIWARGHALVVQGLLDSFEIKWTPEYFIDEYGEQECFIVDCKTEKATLSTVEEFFVQFGDPDRGDEILKLKDWPAQADFRDDFPDLFMDFMNALPIPNYTRRDGILNVASHFATNAIAPDLGPKMYNAFASNEGPGGQGSTRLHMDMADAVNIMMYANDCRNGKPGTAAWDIFKASDSDKIRAYLRRHFDNKTTQYRDPIHSQLFYLDSTHRRRLFEEEGVYSWRIYQRPGEAVFIPAGCAHQVCNLADCIKVAIDFVSLENIDRCEKLTAEFRNENDTFTWKEDVLQLRTMMMYAWHSASQLRKAWEDSSMAAGA